MSLVNEIQAMNPVYNKWYMDDGGIVGDIELLQKVWDLIKSRGPELGLHLNASKCEWSWLNPECKLPCPIRNGNVDADQIKLVPHAEIQMLGVPLGSDHFVSDFVSKKLLGRLSATVDKLVDFEDSQAATYLLRVSYSIVRAVHFMRTVPLSQWVEQAKTFDSMVRKAIEDILGCPMSDLTFAQASLTPKLGGLGLRKTVEHADLAFFASWHESQLTAHETWTPRADQPKSYLPQKQASFNFDTSMHAYLVDQAPNDREAQRLRRSAQPHACGYITATPSSEDGYDTVMKPRIFRVAVLYRLGLAVIPEPIPCPLCEQPINVFGDHATCCAKSGDLIVRHNAIRNLVDNIAAHGMLAPVMEKKGILGPTSGRRPGDVSIPLWSQGKGLAIDVAVTSPLTLSSVRLPEPCEEYAVSQKHKKYDLSFEGTEYRHGVRDLGRDQRGRPGRAPLPLSLCSKAPRPRAQLVLRPRLGPPVLHPAAHGFPVDLDSHRWPRVPRAHARCSSCQRLGTHPHHCCLSHHPIHPHHLHDSPHCHDYRT